MAEESPGASEPEEADYLEGYKDCFQDVINELHSVGLHLNGEQILAVLCSRRFAVHTLRGRPADEEWLRGGGEFPELPPPPDSDLTEEELKAARERFEWGMRRVYEDEVKKISGSYKEFLDD